MIPLEECYKTLKNVIFNSIGLVDANKNRISWISKHYPDIWNSIVDFNKDIESPMEFLWLYENDFAIEYCPICGKKIKFINYKQGYLGKHKYAFCSRECAFSEEGKKLQADAYQKSCLEKYNVTNAAKLESTQKKFKQTELERYGGHHVNSKEYKDLMKEKYGANSNFEREETKQKVKETNIERYGGPSPFCSKEVRDKIDMYDIAKKLNETKRKNKTFNVSKPENELYNVLIDLGYDVRRFYASEKYPFNCDFYISSLDLYIEYQGSQYHHGRPYIGNKDDIEDIKMLKENSNQLKKQKECSRSKTQYDNIIDTWSKRDVKKRTTAIKNKVSLLELYKIPDNDTLKELIEKVSKENLVYQYY